jgi:hydroxymethylpyrimidine pyrophosphatase-like HAD family hydrolase
MALICVYVDLGDALVGPRGSLLHDHRNQLTTDAVRMLEMCWRRRIKVVPMSGSSRFAMRPLCSALGLTSYICEAGCGIVLGPEPQRLLWNTGQWREAPERPISAKIDESGIVAVLNQHYGLDYVRPRRVREVTIPLWGWCDVDEVNHFLSEEDTDLELFDNGAVPGSHTHIYHLAPAKCGSKGGAVSAHMRRCQYDSSEVVAIGASPTDILAAPEVGHFYLLRNGLEAHKDLQRVTEQASNTSVTDGRYQEGVLEALAHALAARA